MSVRGRRDRAALAGGLRVPNRDRHIEIEALLAAGSLALFGAVTGVVLFWVIPAPNEKYAMLLLGALIGVVKDCFARYFSVTKGAAEQRRTIADMAKAAAATTSAMSSTATGGEPAS